METKAEPTTDTVSHLALIEVAVGIILAERLEKYTGRADGMVPSLECEPQAGGNGVRLRQTRCSVPRRDEPEQGGELDRSGRGVLPGRCSGAAAGGRRAYRRRPGGLAMIVRS
jgi:hypothetical protein